MVFIYNYQLWVMAIMFATLSLGTTWAGIYFFEKTKIRSWVHGHERTARNLGQTFSNFFVLFGLLVGLLVVSAYERFNEAGDNVDKEATLLISLYHDFKMYPEPFSDKIRQDIFKYAKVTIEKDWTIQNKGGFPTAGSDVINDMRRTILSFEPKNKRQELLLAEDIKQFNLLVETRRLRLASVDQGLPNILWWILLFGVFINSILLSLQDMELVPHMLIGGVLALALGSIVFLIAELDYPFLGQVSIGPDPIIRIYQQINKHLEQE